jgi:hypothetical protein
MDYLAIVLAALAAVTGLLSAHPTRPPRWATAGVAVALLALALICQFTQLSRHDWVNTAHPHVRVN